MRPEVRHLRALTLLRDPALQPVVEYLRNRKQEVLENMADAMTQLDMYQAQGRAKELTDLLELVENADKHLQNRTKVPPLTGGLF